MFSITNEQIKHFGSINENKFIDSLFLELSELEVKSKDKLKPFIICCIYDCEEYEILNERDVEQFVYLRLRFGDDFPNSNTFDWALKILNHTDIDGTEKIEQLNDYITFIIEA
ncbi:hypothetical protein L3081_08570 [Colwellia sp. MSW7]|jgi:hypothetical protein|uniref:Uncharacterized protein n=1 Tax=Colwellia maritima TaxID=2912588 RepID=A0ABS9WZM6_9GAMM|nr:hypothetical protein [Colwellia maritima]MCI2283443.1 hypothetical protein [Colwellia maritima]